MYSAPTSPTSPVKTTSDTLWFQDLDIKVGERPRSSAVVERDGAAVSLIPVTEAGVSQRGNDRSLS
jgi:hypothetical protein